MKLLPVLFFFIVTVECGGQELTVPVKFLSGFSARNEKYTGTDAFGAVYSVKDDEFHKLYEGVLLKYRALQLGNIYRIDLQNPLQIVLFYKKFNTVVLLDNQLNETARINFSDLTMPVPLVAEAAGLAAQNRLWLFDINTMALGLFDLSQSNFRALTPPFTESPKYYQSDYNYFYWVDSANKCYACNIFGKITSLGSVPEHDSMQIISSAEAIVQKGNTLYVHNMQTGRSRQIALVEKTFEGFQYSAQILSIFTASQINQYKITVTE
ncbi:hypothetical protein CHU92_07155 [Flavobacterium cyanobacteriorum]|uniref:Uncharacterized protein n=1 Tax=Flavobacterium cyanobacteriorum TaxID=2022802 RepID=A0A255Z912_9FLAO|nr:hypothetical protein [Flavobacterium cyanobacteriorum]OYQ37936.1 hypothetical protein CHU92_07155 [Flavobacterium cyanobacteriorum]